MKINDIKINTYYTCIKAIFFKTFKDKHLLVHFIFGIFALGVGTLSTLGAPLLLKIGVDSFSKTQAITTNTFLILMSYGIMWMISQASAHTRALLTYKIEQRITFNLGLKILSHLYTLSQQYYLDQNSGEITNIIRRAQRDIPSIFLGLFFHVIPTLLEFFCVIVLLANLYPIEYCFLLGGILIGYFIYTFLSMKSALQDREKANNIDKKADGIITDLLSHIEAIKIFGQQNFAIQTCKKELKKREQAEVAFMMKLSLIRLGQSLILGIGLTLLTYLVGEGVLNKSLTIGDFILFNGYILQFIIPISMLGHVTQDIKKALVNMKRVLEILLTESNVQEASSPIHLSKSNLSIDFRNVSFTYKERPILKNLSFNIRFGETVLIVGPTGIGKSTLARLILRAYDPNEGQILINKTNIKQVAFRSLYETIGWVPQECFLFNDTIENNIRFARPGALLQEIEEALDQAALADFIRKLPEGRKTLVGDRGYKLSGGERQRIALARLFLKKPKICIFDEATSFLDRNTELTIQENIERFLPQTTKIIITHRPFMIDTAHKIITLNKYGIIQKKVSNDSNLIVNFYKKDTLKNYSTYPNNKRS